MEYIIVVDSCGEIPEELKQDERLASAPLTMRVGNEEIIDDENFDQASFLKIVAECPECPKSACPSPDYYQNAYDCGAKHIYAVTLSAELSGSYNSALLGMDLFKEEHPDVKGHVFNSRSASVGETLIALKIMELEDQGLPFEKVVEQTEQYIEEQNTFFVLENLETLRKNGRLSRTKAMVASALKIKPIMGATKEGVICQLGQARGINKALVKMVDAIIAATVDSGNKILGISHCNCLERAEMVKDALLARMKVKDVILLDTAGISSMYANDGGIIVVI
ncbi:MAG: DegV family protein [Lachnospiraceae bacterium]|nr:DegV family protein [Lachnospiraceae bacterium]